MAKKEIRYNLKASNTTGPAFAGVRRDATRTSDHVTRKFKAMGAGAKTAMAGFVTGAVVTALANPFTKAAEAMEKFDAIAKRARTSGLSGAFYQTLTVGANEASVAQSLLDSSLTAFVKRMGEMRGGMGPLVTGLKAVDRQLLAQLQTATSQEQALKMIADRMAQTTSATQRAAIANAAFGRSGIDMVRVLSVGAQALGDLEARARSLGLVIDDSLLARAEKLQNEYGLATQVLDLQFKAAMLELAPVLTTTATELGGVLRGVNALVGPVAGLTKQVAGLAAAFNFDLGGDNSIWAAIKAATKNTLLPGSGALDALKKLGTVRANQDAARAAAFAGLVDGSNIATPNVITVRPKTPKVRRTVSRRTGDSAARRAARDMANLKVSIAEAEASGQKFGDTMAGAFNGLGSSIFGVITGTEKLSSTLKNLLNRVGSQAFEKLFQLILFGARGGGGGKSSLGGLFSVFAGFFADGGTIPGGQFGVVGEAGPELVRGPATVTPLTGPNAPRAMGGGGTSVNVTINADFRGADSGAVAALSAQLARMQRDLPNQIRGVVGKERQLNPAGAI